MGGYRMIKEQLIGALITLLGIGVWSWFIIMAYYWKQRYCHKNNEHDWVMYRKCVNCGKMQKAKVEE